MENSERQPFDDRWQKAFEGSEAAHSENVWLSIDNALTNGENTRNKRRVVYYQRIAAGLLLVCVSTVLIMFMQSRPEDTLVENQTTLLDAKAMPTQDAKDSNTNSAEVKKNEQELNQSQVSDNASAVETSVSPSKNHLAKTKLTNPSQRSYKSLASDSGSITAQTDHRSFIAQGVDQSDLSKDTITSMDSNPLLARNEKVESTTQNEVIADNSKPLTEAEEKELVRKMLGEPEKDETEKVKLPRPAWVSLGASEGSYAPGTSSTGTSSGLLYDALSNSGQLASALQSPAPNRTSIGTAFSVGMMVGKQVSKRWLVQTGVSYMNRRLDSESNIVANAGLQSSAYYSGALKTNISNNYSVTSPYTITNTTEFISIPVQVGYILVDRKVALTLNAGVASDLFLKNTITDKTGNYQNVSQVEGEEAAFRAVSWSGIASTEVSVRLSKQYRFAIVPGMRYSFTNVIKEDVGTSKPLILDVGFRFRYMFK